MDYSKTFIGMLILWAAAIATPEAQAFGLKPTGTADERIVVQLKSGFWGSFGATITELIVNHFTTGAHEELTNRIWGCEPPGDAKPEDATCASFRNTPPAIIYGVQWNDNPPFKLDSTNTSSCAINQPIRLPDRQPECWRVLFYDAAASAAKPNVYYRQSNGKALLYRTHFGDLQFLHSMASWNGETMGETKAHIMMWAEFSYKVAQGDIAPTTMLSAIKIDGFSGLLGKYWSDVRGLFAYGVSEYDNRIPDVAFGSLLHMVEDSFSESHIRRDAPAGICDVKEGAAKAGRVQEFYAYNSQDSKAHEKRDSRKWMLAGLHDNKGGDAVSVGRTLRALRDTKASWDVVRAYLNRCVYEVADDDLGNPAGPGEIVSE